MVRPSQGGGLITIGISIGRHMKFCCGPICIWILVVGRSVWWFVRAKDIHRCLYNMYDIDMYLSFQIMKSSMVALSWYVGILLFKLRNSNLLCVVRHVHFDRLLLLNRVCGEVSGSCRPPQPPWHMCARRPERWCDMKWCAPIYCGETTRSVMQLRRLSG